MKTVYGKISEEAKLQLNGNEESLPIYLQLQDAPEGTDEEIIQMISDLTGADIQFISIIAQEEYDANVEVEEPYPFENSCNCGCCETEVCEDSCECDDNCCGGCKD